MGVIKDSFTFDDVTLVPQYSTVLPSEAITISKLSSNLNLQIPLMSAAMDTVTESKMAIAISKSGGIGVVHRNLSIEKQVIEVQKVKKSNCLVGAATGANLKDLQKKDEFIKITKCQNHLALLSLNRKNSKKFILLMVLFLSLGDESLSLFCRHAVK